MSKCSQMTPAASFRQHRENTWKHIEKPFYIQVNVFWQSSALSVYHAERLGRSFAISSSKCAALRIMPCSGFQLKNVAYKRPSLSVRDPYHVMYTTSNLIHMESCMLYRGHYHQAIFADRQKHLDTFSPDQTQQAVRTGVFFFGQVSLHIKLLQFY